MGTPTVKAYEPYVPVLEQFASDNGMQLVYVGDEDPAGPRCQLLWVNGSAQMCSLYLNGSGGGRFEVRVLRWGVHDLIGERAWDLRPTGDGPSRLRTILAEAKAWADLPIE